MMFESTPTLPSTMPYTCGSPYDKNSASAKDRAKSCYSSKYGVYSSKQPCVEECWKGGPGREKSVSHAMNAVRSKVQYKKKSAKKSKSPIISKSPKKSLRVKEGCPVKNRSDCTGSCKWASGAKRSFCRSSTNHIHLGEGVYAKRPPKKGCGRKPKTSCTSPCKWASGTKRSFCRSVRNQKKSN